MDVMSAPESPFSCGAGGGEKLFDLQGSGRRGQECPREIWTKKCMFMLFFPEKNKGGSRCTIKVLRIYTENIHIKTTTFRPSPPLLLQIS